MFRVSLVALLSSFSVDARRVTHTRGSLQASSSVSLPHTGSSRHALTELIDSEELLEAARVENDVQQQWLALDGSLEHARAAGRAALNSTSSMLSARMQDISNSIEGGEMDTIINDEATIADIRAMDHPEVILSTLEDITALSHELTDLANVTGILIEAVSSAEAFAVSHPEFGNVFGGVLDADAMATAKAQAEDLQTGLRQIVLRLEDANSVLAPLLSDWQNLGTMRQLWRIRMHTSSILDGCSTMKESWNSMTALYRNDALPLLARASETADTLAEVSWEQSYLSWMIGSGATEDIQSADFEIEDIGGSLCARSRPRVYDSDSNVDLVTMTCNQLPFGYQACRCKLSTDCYVESEDRPEPKDLKRCFRPAPEPVNDIE